MSLSNELNALKTDTDEEKTSSGRLYNAWIDVKGVFAGHDRKSVWENFEFGEDVANISIK